VFVAGSIEDYVGLRLLAGQLGLGLTVAGGIFLIGLIRWVDARMEQRAKEPAEAASAAPAAAAPAPADAPTAPVSRPPSGHWTDAARRQAAPAGPVTDQPDATASISTSSSLPGRE
jgi:hypothetical protein